jgi:hypothetical protein
MYSGNLDLKEKSPQKPACNLCGEDFRQHGNKEKAMKARLMTLAVLVFFPVAAQPVHVGAQWSLYQTVQVDQQPALDVPYVPTPYQVVNEMLTVADVNNNDILYDLGAATAGSS